MRNGILSWLRAAAVSLLAACLLLTTARLASSQGRPGDIIQVQLFPGAPFGSSAYRILYRSTGLKGEPIQVSGVVVLPGGPAPPGGRDIVA